MKHGIFLSIILLIPSTTSEAKEFWWDSGWNGGYHHATPAEGYLRGRASLMAGRGIYLRSLGMYRIYNEEARSLNLDNRKKYHDLFWYRKDQWQARRDAQPKYIDRYEHKLDQAERRHKLKQREKQLIADGVLPPKPEPFIKYNGKKYKSYEDFKGTEGWLLMKQKALIREHKRMVEKQHKKERQQEAIEFLAWRGKLGYVGQQRYMRMSPKDKAEFRKPRKPVHR